MENNEQYYQWFNKKNKEQESLCIHCGACCGACEDPCEHLKFKDGKSFCQVYDKRLGKQKTIKGVVFYCVPIREKMSFSWPGDERCGYKKKRASNILL